MTTKYPPVEPILETWPHLDKNLLSNYKNKGRGSNTIFQYFMKPEHFSKLEHQRQ